MVKSAVEAKRPFVAGIVMHNSDNKNAQGDGYIAYEDKDGILIACVAPEGKTEKEQGHLLIAPNTTSARLGHAMMAMESQISENGRIILKHIYNR